MIDYHIDSARGLVISRAAGRVSPADLTGYFVRLLRDPGFRPELNAMIIVADPGALPTPSGVSALAPLVREWSKRRIGVKWAFVLPDQPSREYIELAIEQVRLTEVFSRCFLSENAALAWLAAAGPAASGEPPRAVV